MTDTVPIGIDGYYALCFKNNKCKTEFDIQTKFSTFGRVISVRKVGSENGIVFVRYKKQSEANACFSALKNDSVYRVEIPRRTKGKSENRKDGTKRKKQPTRVGHGQIYMTVSIAPEQGIPNLLGAKKPLIHADTAPRSKDVRKEKNAKSNVEKDHGGWSSPNMQQTNVQHTGAHPKHRKNKTAGHVEEDYLGWPPLKQDQRLARGKNPSLSEDEEGAYGSPEPCTDDNATAELSPWEESDDNYEQPILPRAQTEVEDSSHLEEEEGACSLAMIDKESPETVAPAVPAYGGWPPPSPHGENGAMKNAVAAGNVDELERLKFLTLGPTGPRTKSYEPFGGLEKCWSRSPVWEPNNDSHTSTVQNSSTTVYSAENYYTGCRSYYEDEEH